MILFSLVCLSQELFRIHKIQNNAARLVFPKSEKDHVTYLWSELHWLPVIFRVEYMLATQFFVVSTTLSHHILQLCSTFINPLIHLGLVMRNSFLLSRVSTKPFGQRSFQYQTPLVLNFLPAHIHNTTTLCVFKPRLKSFLFQKSFC